MIVDIQQKMENGIEIKNQSDMLEMIRKNHTFAELYRLN